AALVDLEDVRRLAPCIRTENVAGGTFSPHDGFIRPLEIRRGYLESGLRAGVQRLDADVTGISRVGGALRVETSAGRHEAATVGTAGGAWAARRGARAGGAAPGQPPRRRGARPPPPDAPPASTPMTIFADGYHFRVRDDHVLLLWPTEGGADP